MCMGSNYPNEKKPIYITLKDFNHRSPKIGGSPNLQFHTLPGTQIYTTHIYTKPTVTQHQIYMGPKSTRTHIFTT